MRKTLLERWQRLSTAAKLLIVLHLSALFLVAGLVAITISFVIWRSYVFFDIDLRHHLNVARTTVAQELEFLEDDAHILASMICEDLPELLPDRMAFSRLLELLHNVNDGVETYVLTGDGEILIGVGQIEPEIIKETAVSIVSDGAASPSFSRTMVADDALLLMGGVQCFDADGVIKGLILFIHSLDGDVLSHMQEEHRLAHTQEQTSPEILLVGDHLILSSDSSVQVDQSFLHSLPVDPELSAENVEIDGHAYRLVMAPLNSAQDVPVAVGAFQSLDTVKQTVRQTVLQVVALGLLLISVNFILILFLVRSVFRPLKQLQYATQKMAAGDLRSIEPIHGSVEVEALFVAFDHMRTRIQTLLASQQSWNRELESQVQVRTLELHELVRQRDRLLIKLISAQEEEQRRVARELHDETSQTLAHLAITLGMIREQTSDEKTRQCLDNAKSLTVDTLNEMNRIIQDLRPRLLDDLGLQPAIQWYVDEHLSQKGIAVDIVFDGMERRLPPHIETDIYRVLQEAINNITRHSEATHAWIHVRRRPAELTIEIGDDGRGFVVEKSSDTHMNDSGFGLIGMRERVDILGGEIRIESEPHGGTRINISIPITVQGELT